MTLWIPFKLCAAGRCLQAVIDIYIDIYVILFCNFLIIIVITYQMSCLFHKKEVNIFTTKGVSIIN